MNGGARLRKNLTWIVERFAVFRERLAGYEFCPMIGLFLLPLDTRIGCRKQLLTG
jgi:hypothetical protein